jgi:hypothetical protein
MAPNAPRAGSDPEPSRRHNRTNRSLALVALTRSSALLRAAGERVLTAATGQTGRRAARAVGLTLALVVLVVALYDRGEVPSAAAEPSLRTPAPGATNRAAGQPARAGNARRRDPADLGGLRGRERPARVGERPAAVAAAWYAAHHGVPRAKVKPLQQDRLSAREVRVLVLADHGRGRLRTELVRVRLGSAGWSVR